jgi:hypothetical protein
VIGRLDDDGRKQAFSTDHGQTWQTNRTMDSIRAR